MSTSTRSGLAASLAKLQRRGQFSPSARAAFLNLRHVKRTYNAQRDIVR